MMGFCGERGRFGGDFNRRSQSWSGWFGGGDLEGEE